MAGEPSVASSVADSRPPVDRTSHVLAGGLNFGLINWGICNHTLGIEMSYLSNCRKGRTRVDERRRSNRRRHRQLLTLQDLLQGLADPDLDFDDRPLIRKIRVRPNVRRHSALYVRMVAKYVTGMSILVICFTRNGTLPNFLYPAEIASPCDS